MTQYLTIIQRNAYRRAAAQLREAAAELREDILDDVLEDVNAGHVKMTLTSAALIEAMAKAARAFDREKVEHFWYNVLDDGDREFVALHAPEVMEAFEFVIPEPPQSVLKYPLLTEFSQGSTFGAATVREALERAYADLKDSFYDAQKLASDPEEEAELEEDKKMLITLEAILNQRGMSDQEEGCDWLTDAMDVWIFG